MILSLHKKSRRILLGVCLLAVVGVGVKLAVSAVGKYALPAGAEVSKQKTVLIDAGHGGFDGGAVGNGVVEKNINLAISLKLQTMLELNGYKVIMTRSDDVSIHDDSGASMREQKKSDMLNRMKMVKNSGADYFLCIHQNQFGQAQYYGAQMFYGPLNSKSEQLAQEFQTQFRTCLQPENEREIKEAGESLYLLYHAKIPSVLVECGFLSNAAEAARLQDDTYQSQIAYTLLLSLLNYEAGQSV